MRIECARTPARPTRELYWLEQASSKPWSVRVSVGKCQVKHQTQLPTSTLARTAHPEHAPPGDKSHTTLMAAALSWTGDRTTKTERCEMVPPFAPMKRPHATASHRPTRMRRGATTAGACPTPTRPPKALPADHARRKPRAVPTPARAHLRWHGARSRACAAKQIPVGRTVGKRLARYRGRCICTLGVFRRAWSARQSRTLAPSVHELSAIDRRAAIRNMLTPLVRRCSDADGFRSSRRKLHVP